MITCRPHHFAISAVNLSQTKAFYEVLRFRLVAEWFAKDGSLIISHLQGPDGIVLEVFTYSENAQSVANLSVGNDLNVVGVKHLGFTVDDLEATRAELVDLAIGEITDFVMGRTGIRYFFIKDPNGVWVEFVQETRHLDHSNPEIIHEH